MLAEAALLLAALAAAAPAGAPAALEVRPAALKLGHGERARILFRGAAEPRLVTTAGTLGPPRRIGPGAWEAELDPPLAAHPQLALLAAISEEGVAFASLPLVGRGVAVAYTEPNAQITVSIRGREFGPATADGSGQALVPVEVPPGERFAIYRGRPLDLRVPPLQQVLVVVDPPPARADVEETVTVHAFAARPGGAPWGGAPLALEVSAGRLGPARETAPGVFEARWTLPAAPAGEVRIAARLPDLPVATAELARAAGPASRLSLRAPERARAGAAPLELIVETADAAGNPVDGEVRLSASLGEIADEAPVSLGVRRASWRAPERLDGRAEAVLEATLGGTVERRRVALAPADAAALSVELAARELPADGRASTDATIALVDRFGNAVDGPPPEVGVSHGQATPPAPDGPGRWRLRYAPSRSSRDGGDELVVRSGGLVARAPVRLLAAPRQWTATARAGVLHAFGGFTAPALGVAAEAWPERLGGTWGLALGLGRVSAEEEDAVLLGGASRAVRAASTRLALDATALARGPLRPRLGWVAGAGAGLVRVESDVGLDGGAGGEERGWAAGLHAVAGIAREVPSWHARVRLEATLGWHADPGMETVRGSTVTLGLALGASHDLL